LASAGFQTPPGGATRRGEKELVEFILQKQGTGFARSKSAQTPMAQVKKLATPTASRGNSGNLGGEGGRNQRLSQGKRLPRLFSRRKYREGSYIIDKAEGQGGGSKFYKEPLGRFSTEKAASQLKAKRRISERAWKKPPIVQEGGRRHDWKKGK